MTINLKYKSTFQLPSNLLICNLSPEITADKFCKLTYPESTACCPRQSTDIAVACEREHRFSAAGKASSGWKRQASLGLPSPMARDAPTWQVIRSLQETPLSPSSSHPNLTLTLYNRADTTCSPQHQNYTQPSWCILN